VDGGNGAKTYDGTSVRRLEIVLDTSRCQCILVAQVESGSVKYTVCQMRLRGFLVGLGVGVIFTT
jgi:hypothetical protein